MSVSRAGMSLLNILSNVFTYCTLLFITRCAYNHVGSPLKRFPGHWVSSLTNIWRFLAVYGRGMQETQLKLHRKHGVAVRMGPNLVSLSDPSLISTVFATKKPWRKTDMYGPNDVVVNGVRASNLFGTRNEEWHNLAIRPIRGMYSMTSVLSLESHIDQQLEVFVSKVDERFGDGKVSIDLAKYLPFFAWDCVSAFTLGKSNNLVESGIDSTGVIKTSTMGLDYFAPISQIPMLDLFLDKNPIKRIGPPSVGWATMVAYKALAERKVESKEAAALRTPDTLDQFIAISRQEPGLVDDNMIVAYLLTNVLAGSDTTSIYMIAAVYYILKTPKVHARLRDEMQGMKLSARPVSWKTLQQMPYFDAVMREASRIHPAVGLSLEREVPREGFTLPDGRHLPGGTAVGMNPWIVNRNEEVFGAETDKFIPERWLRYDDETEEAYEKRRSRMKASDLTFGAGSRVCFGRNLATLQAYKMVATLFNLFEIELERPEKEWTVRNSWFVYQYDVVCKMRLRNGDNA